LRILSSIAAKVKADILWQPGHHRALLQTDLSAICGQVSVLFWGTEILRTGTETPIYQSLKWRRILTISSSQVSELCRNGMNHVLPHLYYYFY